MYEQQNRRGNALIVVMVALAVLLMLVAAAIEFTGVSNQAAISKSRSDEMQACATAARRVLMSRLRNVGGTAPAIDPQTLTLDGGELPSTLDSPKVAFTGHYDDTSAKLTIVALNARAMGASRTAVREMSNTLGPTTLGGQFYRVAVTCHHPNTNTKSELEFTFRYGL